MTAATLTGHCTGIRRAHRSGFIFFEAGLAIGPTQEEAALEVVQPSARWALLPQGSTRPRTVGLVTLPGAFVSRPARRKYTELKASASAQILVLIGLMAGVAAPSRRPCCSG